MIAKWPEEYEPNMEISIHLFIKNLRKFESFQMIHFGTQEFEIESSLISTIKRKRKRSVQNSSYVQNCT